MSEQPGAERVLRRVKDGRVIAGGTLIAIGVAVLVQASTSRR